MPLGPVPRLEIMIDCPDPVALAPFWAGVLGYEVGAGGGEPYVELVPPADQPYVCLQRVPEPKVGKTRIHLDLYVPVERVAAEVDRVVALGATVLEPPVRRKDGAFNFQILADPAGNEFCVCSEHG